MTIPLRIGRENDIRSAVLSAGSSISTLPTGNLKAQDIQQVWRSASGPTWILADLGTSLTLEVTALINTTLDLSTPVRVRYSTADVTGVAGDAYDSGEIPAAVDPTYGNFIHFNGAGVLGRYLRIDGISEAGIWMSGQAWAPSRNMAFGWEPMWRDRSRRAESIGHNLVINRRPRQRGYRFMLRGLTAAEADTEVLMLNQINGSSREILVCRDKDATNLGEVSIWGLLERPAQARQIAPNLYEVEFEVWERL